MWPENSRKFILVKSKWRKTFSLKDEQGKHKEYINESKMQGKEIIEIIYVKSSSSISKRELPFPGLVHTGEGARD